jgi:hypothetical protein
MLNVCFDLYHQITEFEPMMHHYITIFFYMLLVS